MSFLTEEMRGRIEKSLDTMRPYLAADGGDVEVLDLRKDMVLLLRLTGSCSTCPQSYLTMKTGIETAIKQAIPEIVEVQAIKENTTADLL